VDGEIKRLAQHVDTALLCRGLASLPGSESMCAGAPSRSRQSHQTATIMPVELRDPRTGGSQRSPAECASLRAPDLGRCLPEASLGLEAQPVKRFVTDHRDSEPPESIRSNASKRLSCAYSTAGLCRSPELEFYCGSRNRSTDWIS
jgi:hypothetical protein